MPAALIGITSALAIILFIRAMKFMDEKLMYGLVLVGTGFLYVGFVWSDSIVLVACSLQAIVFVLLVYRGIKKNFYLLVAGYFLHGCWDFCYHITAGPRLLPPHYDWFCISLDFSIGIYLLVFNKRFL